MSVHTCQAATRNDEKSTAEAAKCVRMEDYQTQNNVAGLLDIVGYGVWSKNLWVQDMEEMNIHLLAILGFTMIAGF